VEGTPFGICRTTGTNLTERITDLAISRQNLLRTDSVYTAQSGSAPWLLVSV